MPNLDHSDLSPMLNLPCHTIQEAETVLIYYLTANLATIVQETRDRLGHYVDHNNFKNALPILWMYLYMGSEQPKDLRASLPQLPDLYPALYAFEKAVWLLVIRPFHEIYTEHVKAV